MRMSVSWLSRVTAAFVGLSMAGGLAESAGKTHYVVTNDDAPGLFSSGITFYTVGTAGPLTMKKRVASGGKGIAGGFDRPGLLSIGVFPPPPF